MNSLMEKYGKKLVSKCIYIQILKCTETELLGQFMGAGGWNLTHNWLQDGVDSSNWPFVQEILEMLLLCPVDGSRLKSNHTPKIVKNLSVNCPAAAVRLLSTKLVEQWLKIAHQEKQLTQQSSGATKVNGCNGTLNSSNLVDNNNKLGVVVDHDDDATLAVAAALEVANDNKVNELTTTDAVNNNNVKQEVPAPTSSQEDEATEESSKKTSTDHVKYKISNKEGSGGLLLSLKRSNSPGVDEKSSKSSKSSSHDLKKSSSSSDTSESKDRSKDKSSSSSKKSSSSSSSHRSSSKSSSSRDKERSSSSSHKSSSSSSKSSSSKDKSSSSSSSKSSSKPSSSSSSSSSSREKDKERERKKKEAEKATQAEKDKETLNFLQPLPTAKLQKIPKRIAPNGEDDSASEKKLLPAEPVEKKKPSISIEVRKGDKPKTVKTLNSQFRNHGLGEEPPPPPSRKALAKKIVTPSLGILPTSLPSSASLSTTNSAALSPPPAKKLSLDRTLELEPPLERIGGTKMIKAKRKLNEHSLTCVCFPYRRRQSAKLFRMAFVSKYFPIFLFVQQKQVSIPSPNSSHTFNSFPGECLAI